MVIRGERRGEREHNLIVVEERAGLRKIVIVGGGISVSHQSHWYKLGWYRDMGAGHSTTSELHLRHQLVTRSCSI